MKKQWIILSAAVCLILAGTFTAEAQLRKSVFEKTQEELPSSTGTPMTREELLELWTSSPVDIGPQVETLPPCVFCPSHNPADYISDPGEERMDIHQLIEELLKKNYGAGRR